MCRELCVKPAVLPCGHVACLWCTHCAMSHLGESHCALCRAPFNALPALSRALENHHLWCDVGAFAERLEQNRAEEVERGHKSPTFARCDAASVGRHAGEDAMTIVDFGQALDAMESDEAISSAMKEAVERGKDGARGTLGRCETFDPSLGRDVAAFHACACLNHSREPVGDIGAFCGEIASRPVVCQQCGTLYERAHADVLTARAGVGGEWCVACGATREPTRVILALKEDVEATYPKAFIEASRKRCDETLARSLVALEREIERKEAEERRLAEERGVEMNATATVACGDGEDEELSENENDDSESARSTVEIGGATTLVFNHETFTHYGVGCDFCGVYPIVGPRYQCEECATEEFMGFDLCSKCMQNVFEHPNRKRDYRFAQNHTDAHKMVLVRPRPTLIHVMKSLHPELSHAQIMQWLESQQRATREAEAAEAAEAAEREEAAEEDVDLALEADIESSDLADDERSS